MTIPGALSPFQRPPRPLPLPPCHRHLLRALGSKNKATDTTTLAKKKNKAGQPAPEVLGELRAHLSRLVSS